MASRKRLQYQQLAFVPVIAAAVVAAVANVTSSSQVTYDKWIIYQSKAETPFVGETVTIDKWAAPWQDPVRQKAGLKPYLQQALISPVITDEHCAFQYDAFQQSAFQVCFVAPQWYESLSRPPSVKKLSVAVSASSGAVNPLVVSENITPDKWFVSWQDPIRQKTGLKTHLQQSIIQTVIDPNTQIIQNFESRWHQPWSEPVRHKLGRSVVQQPTTTVPVSVQEIVTVDKWYQILNEPVRQKQGLRTYLQQAFIGTVLDPETQIIQGYESRWHQSWSKPVRTRQIATAQQPSFFAPSEIVTPAAAAVGTSAISSQVTYEKWVIYQSYASAVSVPEIVTVDKWVYPWSQPSVMQKRGLGAHLQQAFIAPVLEPNTQIIQTYESRWHFSWSEPVRLKQFPTSEQQSFASPLPTETVTIDKWLYQWSEPVRQKAGLRAHLQQALIATTLDNDTQIIQTYESRWHQPWSEPKRFKPQLPAGEQQAQIQAGVFPLENITEDKWHFPWSEPVRQKIGLRTHLQQAFIAPVLEPNTEIIQTYESRWHFAWSEPVRLRRFPTSEQQSLAFQPPSFEIITADKWLYQWSEPVRQKQGLRTNLHQDFIGVVLNPETQITQNFESRWHQGWSEPVRFRRLAVAQQQSITQPPLAPESFEVITYDKWGYAWSEPVRFRIDPKRAIALAAPFNAGPVLDPDTQISADRESKWHQGWSEPVRFRIDRRLAVALGASGLFAPVLDPETQIIQKFESRWHFPWSEPVRIKPGLRAHLHPFTTPQTPIYPNLFRTIPWFAPLNEPVKVKQWLHVSKIPFFWTTPEAILADITVTFTAREINADSALFAIRMYAAPVECFVSIKEIKVSERASVSVMEPVLESAVSIKETKIQESAIVSVGVPVGAMIPYTVYVTEDGLSYYVTESGSSYYVASMTAFIGASADVSIS